MLRHLRYRMLSEGTQEYNNGNTSVDELSFLLSLCSLHGAVPLKTDMKTEPGHNGAPEGGPLADAATRPPPPSAPTGPRP